MKDTSPRDIKSVRASVEAGYIILDEAATIKGCSKAAMLKWCAAHNVHHSKRHNRWLVHKKELAAAMQQELSHDAS
jgi:hypothetical protein